MDSRVAVCWEVMVTLDDAALFFFPSCYYLPSCLLPLSLDLFEVVWVDPLLQYVLVLFFCLSIHLSRPHLFWEDSYVLIVTFSLVVVRSS